MKAKPFLILLAGLFLGTVFIFYGLVKLLGGQFHSGDFVLDSRTVDGTTMVWTFFGYSPVYGRLIGLAEVLPGVLLLFPRTRTFGALLLLPVVANVTVMDFCFDFPAVKYVALFFLLLDVLLLAADAPRLKPLFRILLDRHPTRWTPLPDFAPEPTARLGRRSKIVLSLAGLLFGAFLLNLLLVAVTPGPEAAAREAAAALGHPPDSLTFLRSRRTGWAGLDMEGYVDFQLKRPGRPTLLRIHVHRPHGFTPWRATGHTLEELPRSNE